MNYKKTILTFLLALGFLFLANEVLAYEVGPGAQGTYQNSINNMATFANDADLNQGNANLEEKIISYISIILSFIGLIFLVLIIIAGVKWMTSGGNDNVVNKAKATLKSSIIGLLIVLGAWVISNGIIQIIVNGNGASPAEHGIYDESF
jgi:hypothetical protein